MYDEKPSFSPPEDLILRSNGRCNSSHHSLTSNNQVSNEICCSKCCKPHRSRCCHSQNEHKSCDHCNCISTENVYHRQCKQELMKDCKCLEDNNQFTSDVCNNRKELCGNSNNGCAPNSVHCSHNKLCMTSNNCSHFDGCDCRCVKNSNHSFCKSNGDGEQHSSEKNCIPYTVHSTNGAKSNDKKTANALPELTSPLNAARLRPTRQKIKNAVISILENGEVCVEFLRLRGKEERVCDVCRISPDGKRVRFMFFFNKLTFEKLK